MSETLNVKINFFSIFNKYFNTSQIELTVKKNTTIKELLDMIGDTTEPSLIKKYILKSEYEVKGSCVILVDGKSIDCLEGLKTVISTNIKIDILPPLSGG